MQNATDIIFDAEQIAKDMAYKYYIDKFKTQDTDCYGELYDGIGYVTMFMTRHSPVKDEDIGCDAYENTIFLESSLYVLNYDALNMPSNLPAKEAASKTIEHHAKIMDSSKTMLNNLKELYRMLYAIPNEEMHKFMIESKIISEDYYPEPELKNEISEEEIVTC